MPKVSLINDAVPALEVPQGANLLDSLIEGGVDIEHSCGGNALCATCRVRVMSGDESLLAMSSAESFALSRIRKRDGLRLACQLQVRGDLRVEVQERRVES